MAEPTPMRLLVAALAKIAVDEHLAAQAASQQAQAEDRPNPVPLPDLGKAA